MQKLLKLSVVQSFRANTVDCLCYWFHNIIKFEMFGTESLLMNDTVKFNSVTCFFADFISDQCGQSASLTSHGRCTISNDPRNFTPW